MGKIEDAKKIVIKIGTSTLTYDTGRTNIRRMAKIASVLSDLSNAGYDITLVTSGAIAIGVSKLGCERPTDTPGRQAMATIGQCELMFLYDKLFGEYSQVIGQMLVTRSDFEDEERRTNLLNTFNRLSSFGAIPIVNENDSVAIEEIVFGDNDTLSAHVAALIEADLLIIFSDIDGLFEEDPNKNSDAKLIPVVDEITDDIRALAGGSGTDRGTGGMVTKIKAAEIATSQGIDTVVMNGNRPQAIYHLLEGKPIGTIFNGR